MNDQFRVSNFKQLDQAVQHRLYKGNE